MISFYWMTSAIWALIGCIVGMVVATKDDCMKAYRAGLEHGKGRAPRHGMTPEQEEHLADIKETFDKMVDSKYREGQREHGGDIWKKKFLVDMAIQEAIDQVVYLLCLKQQIEASGIELGTITEEK